MFPSISDYISSIESAADTLNRLNYLRPVLKPNGQPYFSSGNFAVVFKMQDTRMGNHMALKCFLRDVPDRARRLRLIGEWIAANPSPYLLPMTYHPAELWVDCAHCDREEFDVVLMPWVEGMTLGEYVKECCNRTDQPALGLLAYRFDLLAEWMLNQNMAHGDLKPDNIMVRPDGHLALVDYDGFYVPTLAGTQATETGTPPYRHPRRKLSDFNLYLDDFSLLLLQLELRTLAHFPDWSETFAPGDALLVRLEDILTPRRSDLFATIYEQGKPIHRTLLAEVEDALTKPLIFTVRDLVKPEADTEPEYPETPELIPCNIGDKWGYSTGRNHVIYDGTGSFSEGLAWVKKNGKCGFIKHISAVIPYQYENAGSFSEGLARVQKNSIWGFIDKQGKIIIPFEYQETSSFSEGLAGVKKYDKWGFISKHGITVIPFEYDNVASFFIDRAIVRKNGKWGLIDKHGDVIMPFQYEDLGKFKDGLASAKMNGYYGIVNEQGTIVVPFVYDGMSSFSEGLAVVKKNGKWGFIDKKGVIVVPFNYDVVWRFSEGQARVGKEGKRGYIDKLGNEYWDEDDDLPF